MNKRAIIIIAAVLIIITTIVFFSAPKRPHKKAMPKALVAFVIDDWGYNRNNIDILLQIERPITLSILPNLRYSKEIADVVKEDGLLCDVMLHLPLESKSNKSAELNTIRCDMDKTEIISILERDIKSIHGVIGVSNHQGSRATADKRVMNIIMGELKKRKLFFLDSFTALDSVCLSAARNAGLKSAKRDVFLDLVDKKDAKQLEAYIKKQIQKLAATALKKGSAIGIGHNKALTLKVIKDSIEEMERQGIQIVPVKNLVI